MILNLEGIEGALKSNKNKFTSTNRIRLKLLPLPPVFRVKMDKIDEVKSNKDYKIPFVGLKIGVHEYEFKITNSFFEMFEYSLIQKGEVDVNFRLEKKETMMIGDFSIEGNVEMECDRCTDPIDVAVNGNYQLIYKFDTKESEDETLVTVYPEDFEINIQDSILEFILVSLPSRVVHEEGKCNEEMLDLLSEYVMISTEESVEDEEDDNEEIDPRWSALKGLKNKDD